MASPLDCYELWYPFPGDVWILVYTSTDQTDAQTSLDNLWPSAVMWRRQITELNVVGVGLLSRVHYTLVS